MTDYSVLAEFFDSLDELPATEHGPHAIHPYPAKFKPAIPKAIISALTSDFDVVLDPMCGSGTANVEAALLGRDSIGVDINPISVLVSKAKTTRLNSEDLGELYDLSDRVSSPAAQTADLAGPTFHNIHHWFELEVIAALQWIKNAILEMESEAARNLALTSFSSIIVPVSNQESETHWRRVDKDVSFNDVFSRFARKLTSNIGSISKIENIIANSLIIEADARKLPVASDSIDLVVSSPPYANSHDYYLYHKLRLFWLGYDVRPVQESEFGSRNKHSDKKQPIDTYADAMSGVMQEAARVLRPGARACFVVGDAVIRGEFFSMDELLAEVGEKAGLRFEGGTAYDQRRYTRAFNRKHGATVSKKTHVLMYRR